MSTWPNDKLERQQSADFLTKYLETRYQKYVTQKITDSFVLAIDADWGFGKSFLLQHWKKDLEDLGYPVIYFDAWKNDFSGEPLIGFIAEIDEALKAQFGKNRKAQNLLKRTVNGAKKLIRPAIKTAAEIGVKKLTSYTVEEMFELWRNSNPDDSDDSDKLDKAVDELVVKVLDKCAEEALKEHRNTKDAIQAFKAGLEELVAFIKTMEGKKLPIFILVDELDRCRPTYSVELLENIKHLFGVNEVYFVIATNVNQLTHSISVLYGAGFDSGRYLKRFFDQEYSLPEPDRYKYAQHLMTSSGLDKEKRCFTGIIEATYPQVNPNIKLFSIYCECFKLSLRDQEQIVTSLNAIVLTWSYKHIHMHYLLFLLMLRQRSISLFEQLRSSGAERARVRQAIKELTDQNIEFKVMRRSSNYEHNFINTGLIDIAFVYEDLANRDLKKLMEEDYNHLDFPIGAIKSKLRDEMPSTFNPDQQYMPSLRSYYELVCHAGHLKA